MAVIMMQLMGGGIMWEKGFEIRVVPQGWQKGSAMYYMEALQSEV